MTAREQIDRILTSPGHLEEDELQPTADTVERFLRLLDGLHYLAVPHVCNFYGELSASWRRPVGEDLRSVSLYVDPQPSAILHWGTTYAGRLFGDYQFESTPDSAFIQNILETFLGDTNVNGN